MRWHDETVPSPVEMTILMLGQHSFVSGVEQNEKITLIERENLTWFDLAADWETRISFMVRL